MPNSKYEVLLLAWCDTLVEAQITDPDDPYYGGFRCDTCEHIHGRADNAIFPLLYAYNKTGKEPYLNTARQLLSFRKLLTHEDGAVQNDFGSAWKGITVFSAINLYKALTHFGENIPAEFRAELETLFADSARWVHENVRPGFRANINYYCAACAVNAMAGAYFGNNDYTEQAESLLNYCMDKFSDNGWITGEGQPHDFRTEKGCAPIDIGYDVEESFPCLVDAAVILQNDVTLETLSAHMKKALAFMLPDGGWDNSFGVRNNKWTYYGSRTSDGCIGALTVLGKLDSVFYEAARRTFEILERCTQEGKLYGGLHYHEHGQKPCIHHTFCHAAALADALCEGLTEHPRQSLPGDDPEPVRYYPELDTYKLSVGPWLCTVTAYDYSTYTYPRGAAHASGGALSLLYHRTLGPVIAGSVYEYKPTEIYNMQLPENVTHCSLIPRAEYTVEGVNYATCLDGEAQMKVRQNGKNICVEVTAKLRNIAEKATADDTLSVRFEYILTPDCVTITATPNKSADGLQFVLPIVQNTVNVHTENTFRTEDIFFLAGGFAATEYTFPLQEKISIELR